MGRWKDEVAWSRYNERKKIYPWVRTQFLFVQKSLKFLFLICHGLAICDADLGFADLGLGLGFGEGEESEK